MKLTPNQINIIYEYASWLAEHPVPCDECISKQDSVICDGCDQQLDWIKNRSQAKTVFMNLVGCIHLNKYMKNGWIPGKNLILTSETDLLPLDIRQVEELVKFHLFP